jgi:RNA polymerase sigma-70 factor, ECF subfamily
MVETARAALRQMLVAGYDDLKLRLTRRLGSADIAAEVLHETWLRLGKASQIPSMREPRSYLYRMVLNVAVDHRRAHLRWLNRSQIDAILQVDGEPDPERIVVARSDVAALERALAELPARCREIFLAALLEDLPYREIAARFQLSLRSVEREMNRAFAHCDRSLADLLQPSSRRGAKSFSPSDCASSTASDEDDDN